MPGRMERAAISSITSTSIRTIVFKPQIIPHPTIMYIYHDHQDWLPLDEAMYGLVNKLCTMGYEHTLELEFHFDPKMSHRPFLQRFREKGRVKILDTSGVGVLVALVRLFHVLHSVVIPDLMP